MTVIRISRIRLAHIKNVSHGEVVLRNPRRPDGGSFLALYGQNGSGKTALIDALAMLKVVMSGEAVPDRCETLLEAGCSSSQISFEFEIQNDRTSWDVFYELELSLQQGEAQRRIGIRREVLSVAKVCDGIRARKTKVMDTVGGELAFLPEVRLRTLVGGGKNRFDGKDALLLLMRRQFEHARGRSFIFSESLRVQLEEKGSAGQLTREWSDTAKVIAMLGQYARRQLYVMSAEARALDLRPLFWSCGLLAEARHEEGPSDFEKSQIPESCLPMVKKAITRSSGVISKMIPGLRIDVRETGHVLLPNGERAVGIELMAERGGRLIRFEQESEGIKSIFSKLPLLIAVYNNSSVTVAIDDMDAGFFEYLLGEVLQLLTEKGRGQLIFTAQNLRPLEMMDRGFIAFTTTNAQERYARMNRVRDVNNLRDVYYREVSLGDGRFHELTSSIEMGFALKRASPEKGPWEVEPRVARETTER